MGREDAPKWPLSTINADGKMYLSRDVMIVKGNLATDAPNEEISAFKKQATNLVEGNCMKEGIILGRSTSFITAVMCEMLRAYTVASTRPLWETFNTNKQTKTEGDIFELKESLGLLIKNVDKVSGLVSNSKRP